MPTTVAQDVPGSVSVRRSTPDAINEPSIKGTRRNDRMSSADCGPGRTLGLGGAGGLLDEVIRAR